MSLATPTRRRQRAIITDDDDDDDDVESTQVTNHDENNNDEEEEEEEEEEYTPARSPSKLHSHSRSRARPSRHSILSHSTPTDPGTPRRRSTRLSTSSAIPEKSMLVHDDSSTIIKDEGGESDAQIPPVPALPSSLAAKSIGRPRGRGGRRGRGMRRLGGSDVGVGIEATAAGRGRTSTGRARTSRVSGLVTPSASATPEPDGFERDFAGGGEGEGERGGGLRDGSVTPTATVASTPVPGSVSTALADITSSALNEQGPLSPTPSKGEKAVSQLPTTPTVVRIDARNTPMLEKPMDIAARAKVRELERLDAAAATATATTAPSADNVDNANPDKDVANTTVVPAQPSTLPTNVPDTAPSGPKPRIVITYLTLTNFKSYAGRQEVGPFHASFSSVVGPNGSGKSNVIDSLLFVFGFRASKMRQGKISALIHNSAAYPDLGYCEVEVQFQEVVDVDKSNAKCGGAGGADSTGAMIGHKVVPDSTLAISRKAFKNNSSKYYINGRESTFTAVTTLLRDRGVDLDHKRFLILQGEVESIAQMKPKAPNEHEDGLLEYLEDIVGTSRYKTPIEESAQETEALNEVCVERSSRVQHVEKEKNSLEEKKNAALAYIKDENELAMKQSALYQISIEECNDTLAVTRETASKLQQELDDELRKHEGSEEGIKQLQKKHKASAKEYEALEKQTQAVLKEIAKLDKETVKFDEKKKFLGTKQRKLEKAVQTSSFAINEAATQTRQCSDDIARNAQLIASMEEDFRQEERELAAIRDSLKGKTQGLSDAIAAKQKQLEPWTEKIASKQSAMTLAQSELEMLQERQNAGATAVREVEARIASFEEAKASTAEQVAACREHRRALQKDIQRVEKRIGELAAQEPKVKANASSARQKADEARASLSATQTQGNVLTGLMRLKESGRIDGFHARLGNLGAIEERYDVAISTACPALDNMVVDSVDVGQKCIDYLRKNNLGRANFILLDRLAQRDLSAIETPENAPRLFDLVTPREERFRPAFFSVLQNTLVAEDLEQANRIAYGARRWRVVTLDGQLIDKSGTMSGGGTRVARGGMSASLKKGDAASKEHVARLEHDRDELETSLQEFRQQQHEAEAELKRLLDELPRTETQAQKLALEVESFERNIADARRRIEELGAEQQQGVEGSADDGVSVMASLEKQIGKLEKEIAQLRGESAGVEEEIKSLQDKIMEIGGVRLRGQKAKVDGLKEQMDTLRDEMSTAEVNKAKAEKQRVKMEKAVADAESELETVKLEMDKVDEDMKAQTQDASGSKRQAEEAQEALETKKDELQALKTELDSATAELNECRGVEIEMRNRLEEHQKALQENQRRLRHWQDKLGKVSLQNTSDIGDEEHEPDTLPTYSRDELQDMDKAELKAAIATLEERTQSAPADTSVLSDYRRRVAEHASRTADLASSLAARDAAKQKCDELRRARLEGFMAGFSAISARLKEMYQLITVGGNAELELVDSLDPFAEGILFSVMPPKKSWKNIANLSGGEKTLSSLALVFALHHYKPTPLYVMDEIDAALDFRNVSIVASYIKERTKNAQFIVISLRNNMFELASRLVGVYKVNHMTKSVTVENKDYISRRAA